MPSPRFDAFVLFADMRTGSNFLEANLNALPGVRCDGELFNPGFIGRKDQTEVLGVDLTGRDRDPLDLLARQRAAWPGLLTGFRFFRDHDARVLAAVLPDPRTAKIILTRNPLDSYVSWKIAQATGQWRMTQARNARRALVAFDASEFAERLAAQQAFHLHLLHGLQTTGQTAFYLDYEDVQDPGVLNGLARFLGVAPVLTAPVRTLKKQNPEPIEAKLSNPAEMAAALARLDRFDLGRTPNFEPRRSAALALAVVARAAPILYLPVRGGPEAAVTAWLASIGAGGVDSGLTPRDLRQWRRAHPGHRSFTVLRHPLARAHAAFCARILTDALPDLRDRLIRTHGLDLPPHGAVSGQTLAEHRAAFLGFLQFVKQNLGGQTGMRVDAAWASQGAVLQGFADVQAPDLVLREDRLPEGLAWLAAEVGVAAPSFAPAADDELHPFAARYPLSALYDAEIEAAAQAAYERDYLGFGFGPWRPAARRIGHAA